MVSSGSQHNDGDDGRRVARRIEAHPDTTRRAFVDSRTALLCTHKTWEAHRTALTESFRRHGDRRRASEGKRLRAGGDSVGQRTWQYPYIQIHGDEWWESFQPGYAAFLQTWEALLGTYKRPKIYEYFCTDWKHVPGGVVGREFKSGTGMNEDGNEGDNTQLARRLAIINERQAVFDIMSNGVGIEIKGDSLLVQSWLTGRWRCHNRAYRERVHSCINDMYALSLSHRARAANVGRDIFVHEYREANTRADELTHLARDGQTFHHNYRHRFAFERDYLKVVACRGGYDGGVCSKGSACGYWMQIGYLNMSSRVSQHEMYPTRYSPYPTTSSLHYHADTTLIWRDAVSAAWMIPGATITECELAAAEALTRAIRIELEQFDASDFVS